MVETVKTDRSLKVREITGYVLANVLSKLRTVSRVKITTTVTAITWKMKITMMSIGRVRQAVFFQKTLYKFFVRNFALRRTMKTVTKQMKNRKKSENLTTDVVVCQTLSMTSNGTARMS